MKQPPITGEQVLQWVAKRAEKLDTKKRYSNNQAFQLGILAETIASALSLPHMRQELIKEIRANGAGTAGQPSTLNPQPAL